MKNKLVDNTRTIMPNGRYTDNELRLIKVLFCERIDLLKAIRKRFLQLEVNEEERKMLEVFKKDEPYNLLSKTFLPELDGDAPLHQIIDLWMTVNLDKGSEEAAFLISARGKVIKYLKQRLSVFKGKEITKRESLEIKECEAPIDCLSEYSFLMARNTIIAHIEQQLNQLNILAGKKEETPEETIKRIQQDSSQ